MTLQEIADRLNGISNFHYAYINEDTNKLTVRICAIANGFGYEDSRPKSVKIKEKIDRKLFFEIFNNPNVEIMDCDECWGCGDW